MKEFIEKCQINKIVFQFFQIEHFKIEKLLANKEIEYDKSKILQEQINYLKEKFIS
jgi:hypothetical protein